jgi:hypothetical protein
MTYTVWVRQHIYLSTSFFPRQSSPSLFIGRSSSPRARASAWRRSAWCSAWRRSDGVAAAAAGAGAEAEVGAGDWVGLGDGTLGEVAGDALVLVLVVEAGIVCV